MERNRNWFGWIAIGLGALALLVALFGRGQSWQMNTGPGGVNSSPSYAQPATGQQNSGPQAGSSAPDANAQPGIQQPGMGPQRGGNAPGAGAQQGPGQPGMGRQGGAGPGADAQRGPGRPGDGGFGMGGGWRLPFRLVGGSFQVGMLALLALLGVWLLRGRLARGASQPQVAPAQGPAEPQAPAGESYTDESYSDEPGEQA